MEEFESSHTLLHRCKISLDMAFSLSRWYAYVIPPNPAIATYILVERTDPDPVLVLATQVRTQIPLFWDIITRRYAAANMHLQRPDFLHDKSWQWMQAFEAYPENPKNQIIRQRKDFKRMRESFSDCEKTMREYAGCTVGQLAGQNKLTDATELYMQGLVLMHQWRDDYPSCEEQSGIPPNKPCGHQFIANTHLKPHRGLCRWIEDRKVCTRQIFEYPYYLPLK